MASLEHIGIAVDDPEAAAALYEDLLGTPPYKQEAVEAQSVRTHFIDAGSAKLELLESLNADSAVARFLDRRGEGLHHLAFEVADLQQTYEHLQSQGYEPLDAPHPGADDKHIFFLHPKQTGGVLVEFCQTADASLTPTFVPFRDGQLATYERGDHARPSVLLLHGLADATNPAMTPLLRHLEPHFHVLALDFPGHGASDDFADRPLSFALFTESIMATLDQYDATRAHAFGFSMGGAAALHWALHQPERARRLAVHATNVDWTAERAQTLQTRLTDVPGSELQERLARYRHFAGRLPDINGFNLKRLRAPVLVSAFDRDPLFDLDLTLRLYRALPEARLAVVPGARHAARALPLDAYGPLLTDWLGAV